MFSLERILKLLNVKPEPDAEDSPLYPRMVFVIWQAFFRKTDRKNEYFNAVSISDDLWI